MNALNTIYSYLQRDTSINTLEKLGVDVLDEATQKFRNAFDIFQDINARWGTSSDAIKDTFVESAEGANLFSEEMANALGMQEEWTDLQKRDISQSGAGVRRRTYYIAMIERLSKAQEVLNGLTTAGGYSQAENANTMDTLEKKYQSLKTAAQQLAVALGDAGLLDMLKGLTDTATDAASGFSKMDDEARTLLITALELLAVTKTIKAVGGLFGANATLGTAIKVLPGWTKLLAIIPAVIGAIALYKNNLDDSTPAMDNFRRRQEKINETYEEQKKVIQETKDSMFTEAKTIETLASKLDVLNQKESLNVSEKAQMKAIVDQLNSAFPNLSLAIDEQTGKIIGNTSAIWDNIDALRVQAVAQAYRSEMEATATQYVNKEALVGDLSNAKELEGSKYNELLKERISVSDKIKKAIADGTYVKDDDSAQRQQAIQQAMQDAEQYGWSSSELNTAIIGIDNQFSSAGLKQKIINSKETLDAIEAEYKKESEELSKIDDELKGWADKALETASKLDDFGLGIGTSDGEATSTSETGGTSSSSYKNTALDNALKYLDYKKYINELTLEDEIATLNQIKANHINTADELMDINKRIYDAEQNLMDETYRKSVDWISDKKALGQLSARDEIAAWERVKNSQINNIEAVKQATINLYKLRKQLEEEMQNSIINNLSSGLNAQKNVASRRLDRKQEKEILELQKDIFNRKTEDSYNRSMDKKISKLEKQLELLNKQIDAEEKLKRLREIEDEIAKTKADTRFAYIDETTGKEIYSYDRGKVKDLEKQYQEELQSQQDEAEKEKIQSKIDALKEEQKETNDAYDEALKDLEKSHRKQMESFEEYWDDKLDKESINQQALKLIQQLGHQNALNATSIFNEEMLSLMEQQSLGMYEQGKNITDSLFSGLFSNLDDYIEEYLSKLSKIGSGSIKNDVHKGSTIGGIIGAGTGGNLGGAGAVIGGAIGAIIGKAKDMVKGKYAVGGVSDFTGLAQLDGQKHSVETIFNSTDGKKLYELVHNTENLSQYVAKAMIEDFDKLTAKLPNFNLSQQPINNINNSKRINVYIQNLKANDFDDMMNSLSPYINAR